MKYLLGRKFIKSKQQGDDAMNTYHHSYTYDSFHHNPSTYKVFFPDYYRFKGQLAYIFDKGSQNYDIDVIQDNIWESYIQGRITHDQYAELTQMVMDIERTVSKCNIKFTRNNSKSQER